MWAVVAILQVIITDAVVPAWNESYLASKCGDREVVLKQRLKNSTSWGSLEELVLSEGPITMGRYLELIRLGLAGESYLFDFGIPKFCQPLMEGHMVSRYFVQDFLQRLPPIQGGFAAADK